MKSYYKLFLIVCAVTLFISGCYLKSVHPLIAEKDLVLLSGLEGRWETSDERWTFVNDPRNIPDLELSGDIGFDDEDKPENIYLVFYEDLDNEEADTTLFIGSVGFIANHYFLDLYILELKPNKLRDIHYFPVHTFSKIEAEDGKLHIEFFKDEWIKTLIAENRVRIKHEKVDENVLITASTRELQKFVSKYADDEDAYDDPIILSRK